MPTKPLSPCRTCGQVGCQAHIRPAWGHARPVKRIRGTTLQRLRQQLFSRQPLCVLCQAHGRTTLATIRDHIKNLQAPGGTDTEDNVQAVCETCHTEKTAEEAKRGAQRARQW